MPDSALSAAIRQTRNVMSCRILAHWLHYVKRWRHPQYQKYITYCISIRGPSRVQVTFTKNSGEIWTCGFWYMPEDRHTDMLIAILCPSSGGKVTQWLIRDLCRFSRGGFRHVWPNMGAHTNRAYTCNMPNNRSGCSNAGLKPDCGSTGMLTCQWWQLCVQRQSGNWATVLTHGRAPTYFLNMAPLKY